MNVAVRGTDERANNRINYFRCSLRYDDGDFNIAVVVSAAVDVGSLLQLLEVVE